MTIERLMEQFVKEPGNLELLGRLVTTVGLARTLPFEVGLWTAQNLWYELSRTAREKFASLAEAAMRTPGSGRKTSTRLVKTRHPDELTDADTGCDLSRTVTCRI
jgi:hypothetical protein